MYKKTILNGILGVCLTIPALSATAGFESGIPAGWTGVGNFGTITGIDGDVATHLTAVHHMAMLLHQVVSMVVLHLVSVAPLTAPT